MPSIYRELEERWNVYYVLPDQSSYFNDPEIADHWRELLGERFELTTLLQYAN